MTGTKQLVKIILSNPWDKKDTIDYDIVVADNVLAQDWLLALKEILHNRKHLEKNYCFMGFPYTARDLNFLTNSLNKHVNTINRFFDGTYQITENFIQSCWTDNSDLGPNHEMFNLLHNHFEVLQGTVWDLSDYYKKANYETKYAIRQLNNICHELESYVLSQRKLHTVPYWIRPSQITTFLQAERYQLTDEHRKLFTVNGYDRVLGGVYMHWTQIGKTLFEVFRDEGAPDLDDTICEAITELKFYSGEFDVEWGNNVVYGGSAYWHTAEQNKFRDWLSRNGKDYSDPKLSLGYLPIGQVDLQHSFGTTDAQEIWKILGTHLNIQAIEVDGIKQEYQYCWSDSDYENQQIEMMRPGYDFSSKYLVRT
jgi:hypothetical protein